MQKQSDLQVDLINCDTELIQFIGKIQPHGFVIIVDEELLLIEQVSENLYHFIQIEPENIIGKNIEEFFTEAEGKKSLQFTIHKEDYPTFQHVVINNKNFICSIHRSSKKLVLEFEPFETITQNEILKNNSLLLKLANDLNKSDTVTEYSNLVTEFIHQFLNYDRTLIFKFDEDWNAEVLSEKVKPGIHSFAGHHFPASDIPVPARMMLEKMHVRQIPNVMGNPARLIPYIVSSENGPIDLTLSELRNPSEIHLEYLRNMNVMATISYSIIVKEKLWGLLSCHNHTTKIDNYNKKQVGELAVKLLSNIILSHNEKVDFNTYSQYKENEEKIIEQIKRNDIVNGLFYDEVNIMDVSEAAGAAIIMDNKIIKTTHTPDDASILEIVNWLSKSDNKQYFVTRQLSKHFPEAIKYKNKASGLLGFEISKYNNEYLLFFKPEFKEIKSWAGDPSKPVSEDNQKISPRKSFNKWEEEISGKSLSWNNWEIDIAQLLTKDVIAIKIKQQAQKLEKLNIEINHALDNLKIKNRQLNDFAHTISHNLRSPIINIESLYSLYKESPDFETSKWVLDKMSIISKNLLSTFDDLYVIINATGNQVIHSEKINFKDIVDKEIQNLEASILESEASIQYDLNVTEVILPKTYIESIVHNLISNAIKYRAADRKPEVMVKTWMEGNTFNFSVADNGLGMDLDRVRHKLFGLFKTFHYNKASKGLGLYITKHQIDYLGGKIDVASEPDIGTTFTVKIPLDTE